MSLNIDWEKLRSTHKDLQNNSGLSPENDIIFLMILRDGKAKKSVIKFKDFLTFFWTLSESKTLNVLTLVVQDKEGRIIYRHKQRTRGGEEIPDGGHSSVIQNWNTLNSKEKEVYMRLFVSQILQNYDD